MEEFSEEEDQYYNECINKLINGDYSGTYKIKLEDLDDKLEELESKRII